MNKTVIGKNKLRELLHEIQQFLKNDKHRLLSAGRRELPAQRPTPRHQYLQRIKQRLSGLHNADIAHLLEGLPIEERLMLWQYIPTASQGNILLQLSEPVREILISAMQDDELITAAENLQSDEIADLAYLAQSLPDNVVKKILQSLPEVQRQQMEEALSYPEGTVGSLMDFSMTTVHERDSIAAILAYLRKRKALPSHSHHLYIVDDGNELKGYLPLQQLVTLSGDKTAGQVMNRSLISFIADDSAQDATNAFDRYELSSAPVVDENNKLIGRVCINDIINFMRESAEAQMLNQMGFWAEEDRFSGIWKGANNRWLWLVINLLLAFTATRVITLFEDTIAQFLMLATLMPIVASIGGNVGNQTCTLIIRALALGQITPYNIKQFYTKEIGISIVNGLF